LLFWLGSIEFDTPRGRFILTASREVHSSRCRRATDDEAAQAWRFLERHLMTASYHELRPFYELHQELTSEPFGGHNGDPHPSDVIHAIESALWSKRLHLEFQEPFGPLQEPEWEPPRLKPKGPPAQTPSEIWGRRTETFIGIRLKDQNGDPIAASRIRVKLPDGSTKEGATNDQGEVEINGFTQDGSADITFLDHAKPGKAEAPEWPEEKEFRTTVVDEMGKPVPHVWLWFRHGKAANLARADDAGVATYKTSSDVESVNVSFESADELARVMRPMWSTARPSLRGNWLKPEDGKVVVVALKGGAIQQQLPAQASDSDDDAAIAGDSKAAEQYQDFDSIELTPDTDLQLSVQPHTTLVRLVGMNFDTDKSFLLPTALPAMRRIRDLYAEHRDDTLFIVGHADAAGGVSHNETLSLERAASVLAYLSDDVDSWIAQYSDSVSQNKRWGKGEDKLMLRGLVGRKQGLKEPETKAYQQWHNALPADKRAANWQQLEEDGNLGPFTRAQLIGDYMNLDGTTLPSTLRVAIHGCGEAFPLPEPSESCAWERFSSQRDRRVEFLFFNPLTGIAPMPASATSAPGSLEYPCWLAQAEIEDLTTEEALKEVTFVEMHDALFRTNSAVILPEGEDPNSKAKAGGKRALTSVGLFASALRYNEEHEGKKLFIAGHTDTKGKDQFNQPLSEERAKVALALLTGDRASFAKLCQNRHDGVDLTQIFHWVADSPDFEFKCKPTLYDQPPSTTTVTHFKQEYNAHFDEKFSDIDGAKKFASPDGTQNEALWGAIFDCYEYGLRCELGDMENSKEGKDELTQLRKKVVWVDDGHKTMGFGERFPVDELAKNDMRSQSNRRVEVMMFDEDEKPDLAAIAAAPDAAEIYMPGEYAKRPVKPMVSARPWRAVWDETTTWMGESRKMQLSAPGLPDGETVKFTVEAVGYGKAGTAPGAAAGEMVTASFDSWDEMTGYEDAGELASGASFPTVQFKFVAEAGGRRITSRNQVEYADKLLMKLVAETAQGDYVFANERYALATPWGRRWGTTDKDGIIEELGLAPGGASVLLRGRTLVAFGELRQGWHYDA
jgi:outer membrane protein OmpA-like peptidoglycan-associated protein